MKAFEWDRVVVRKQIFDFLFEGNNLVDCTAISKMSVDHDKQEVAHASSKYQTLLGDDMIASEDFKLNSYNFRRMSLIAKLCAPQSTL